MTRAGTSEGGEGRRLAAGTLAQQGSQVAGLLAMFAIITVLARELSLAELGVYGLLNSIVGYLLIIQNAAAGATVRTIAAAAERATASRALSSAAALYLVSGAAAGVLLALLGLATVPTLGLEGDLAHQVRLGGAALGGVTLVGWPLTVYRDGLRAGGLLVRTAAVEVASMVAYAALVLGLAVGAAPLWLLIGASGSIPLLAGFGCLLAARDLGFGVSARSVSRATAREILALAGWVSATEIAAAGIYVADRAILGSFTSAATVALFEGPVRAHNLVRSLNAAVTVSVLPTATRLHASGDTRRLADLLVRGLRYTLALIVPVAVTGMVLAAPLLDVWLGDRFREGGAAMSILLGHWLLSGCTGVLGAILIGTGNARELASWAALVAGANVALALALAPGLELEGVAIAVTAPYVLLFPLLLARARRTVPVALPLLLRRAFVPALAVGAGLAAALLAVREAIDPEAVPALAGLGLGALLAAWATFYLLVLDSGERALVRALARR